MNPKLKSKAKKVRAIFFDIDGTLFSNRTSKVPQSALKALDRASKNGIMLFLATGRHKSQIEYIKELDGVDFAGYITLNGQCCYGRGNLIYKNPIGREDVRRMAAYAQKNLSPCLFLEEDSIYVNLIDEYVRKEHAAVASSIPEQRDVSRVFEREILQMGLYLPDEDVPDILGSLRGCSYTKWKTNGLDIVPAGGTKWIGIGHTIEYFGLTREQTMAFGDNDNDVEMLANSGISVAMGNAEDYVKAVADYVTEDVDEDGIYNAMQKFFDWI